MPGRPKRKPINVEQIKVMRARGLSYEEIGRQTNRTASAIWRAINQPHRKVVDVPAGGPHTVYFVSEHWKVLGDWSRSSGLSRSRVLARLVEREEEFLAVNDRLFEGGTR